MTKFPPCINDALIEQAPIIDVDYEQLPDNNLSQPKIMTAIRNKVSGGMQVMGHIIDKHINKASFIAVMGWVYIIANLCGVVK